MDLEIEWRDSLPSTARGPARPDLLFVAQPSLWETVEGCTHCGMCLNACPTYRLLGDEADSPRGRIFQIREVGEGRMALSFDFATHMTTCLACRACETACPATLGFGRLVEAARAEAVRTLPLSPAQRVGRRLLFRTLFAHPALLRAVGRLMRLYQASGVRALVQRSGVLARWFPGLAAIEPLQPDVTRPWFPADGSHYAALGERRARVALFNGCIMPLAFGPTNAATVRVLQANGCEVVVPQGQGCCGALAVHAGEREAGLEVARRTIIAFEAAERTSGPFDAVIINAAGCGLALKEYGHLFHGDPIWEPRAQRFAAKVYDVTEWLAALGLRPPLRPMPLRVTYQDPCHLAHGQGVRSQPRALLRAIPGLTLVEMRGADRCCGSAGIYNITHAENAAALLQAKMKAVIDARPDLLISANPGCLIQLQAGCHQAGLPLEVLHIVELLDRAYRS